MPTKKHPTPPRAPRGSTPRQLLVALPVALDEAARTAAARAGLTVSEWWRRAGQAALDAATSSPRR